MRLVARKGKFACIWLTLILSGSLSTDVVFADDESKTVSAKDEQPKKDSTAKTEALGQSDSATETSAPQEEKRRDLPVPFDPFSKKDFFSIRPIDYIVDFKGQRSGFATTMASWTVGMTHSSNELVSVRPGEIRIRV